MTEAPSRKRCYRQSMGLWINEPMLAHPEEIDAAVNTLADAGYGIIRIFIRNTNYTHRSPEIVAAVDRAARVARNRGMLIALDCEPHAIVGSDMGRQFPNAMGTKLVRHVVKVVDGEWTLRALTPPLSHGMWTRFDGVEAAFLRSEGDVRHIEVTYSDSRGTQWYHNGNIHRELVYMEEVPSRPRQVDELRGTLPKITSGELTLFLRYTAPNLVDFWSDGFRAYFEDLVERYRDVPLDGFGWDEPAVDADWNSYRYGAAFASAFRRLNGYDLRDRLHLLDAPGMPAEAVRVRLDYYRTLNEGLAQAQANFIAKAKSVFGDDILLGTHHTWQGESGINDNRAGAVDYFRLNDNMDAGYTDSPQWDAPVVAYAYTLGSSLARLTPSGEAVVNTWHWKPTVANIRRNVALMSLMNITWFNIWFGRDCDCVRMEGHYTWPATMAAMQTHQETQRLIGARRPVVDVAIWHGWEGACGLNNASIAYCQKIFWINTSQLFIERNIAADFIDSRLLADSTIENGRLVNTLGKYRVLIVPYALALPRRAFDACVEFARAGGRVVFVGAPVATDDLGNSLSDEFAKLVGMPAMSLEHYLDGLNAICTIPDFRRQRVEVCRSLPKDMPRTLVSCEGERHGVSNAEGTVVFLTDLDPQERLIECIADVLRPEVRAFGDNLMWRLYRTQGDDLLVVAARHDRPLSGVIWWQNKMIELTGGTVGVLSLANGQWNVRGDATARPITP